MTSRYVTVVIRYAGERTLDICKSIVTDQVPDKNVFVIEEKPFSKAVERTFQIGIDENRKWTLAIDADVLVTSNCVHDMISSAEKLGDNLYFYQGYIIDKLYSSPREGGPHLYKTEYLGHALELLKKNLNSYRPESSTNLELTNHGYKIVVDNKIYALHDYWQYYVDIYRKAYFHSIKHFDANSVGSFMVHWKSKMIDDLDYKVALNGFFDGIKNDNQVRVDIDYFKMVSKGFYSEFEVSEKENIPFEDFSDLKKTIENKILESEMIALRKKIIPEPKPSIIVKMKGILYRLAKKLIK